ncbi:hypothetical protein ACPPVO_52955 [Dactylosporangium sp. McL0621]|uniref:hypothetical protein n=1 Tax=Dactylosporangium sp. McL0621 TaxID=3415678 RepID=UPI003CEED09E
MPEIGKPRQDPCVGTTMGGYVNTGGAHLATMIPRRQKEVVAMRGKLLFLGGLAAGFVLGARAGREKYEELKATALKIKESPTVQEAAGVVQEQATRLYSDSKTKVTDKLANSRFADTEVGQRLLNTSPNPAIERDLATTGTPTTPSTGSSF